MPTNSRPGNRWLAGALVLSVPIMGPRMPCARSGSDDSINRNIATIIDLQRTTLFLLLLLFLPSRLLGRSFLARRGRNRIRTTLRTHRQATLDGQFHRTFDWDMRHACLLVHPAVAVKLLLLVHDEFMHLVALVHFEQWSVVPLKLVL